ncbi:MAG: hypothetical protein K6B70_02135 [Clostridia bacterium]|nr:hypothetical protein [Clostridia bacterium]
MLLEFAVTAIVSILTYFFMIEEYNYQNYAAFSFAAAAALLCFIIWEDIRRHKKIKEDEKWARYRQRVIEATTNNVEQEKSNKEVRVEDYDFLFTMTTNDNPENVDAE